MGSGRWCILAAAAFCCLAAAPPRRDPASVAAQLRAAEQDRAAGLAAQQQAQAQATAVQRQAEGLAEARVAAASRLRAAENATVESATRMSDLAAQRRDAERRLAQQADNLGPLLPLIERLALYPLETLLAIPAPPDQTLRGVTVLQGITRDMERQAEALNRQRAEVARLTAAMQAAAPGLAAAQQEQANQAALLDAQIDQAHRTLTEAEQQGTAAARQVALAAGRAETLRDVIAQIEAAQAKAEAEARAEAAADARARKTAAAQVARTRVATLAAPAGPGLGTPKGEIGAPVAGTVIRAFGQQTDAGPASGISYQPAPSARVSAPCSGKVVFSGPFRSYGLLLILDCGGGYHFVLAGLDRLDAHVGGIVRQGEPVGVMPGWDPREAGSRPALYVELRRNGSAVNPAPFLRAHG